MPTTPNFSQPAIFSEVATPTVPDSGYLKVYGKYGALCSIANGGTEKSYVAISGSGLPIGAYTLPTTDGTSSQVLQTNGSGTVTWQTVSGGGGITSINGDTTAAQLLTVGTSGTDFAIDSVTTAGTSVFNIPNASATARGLITTGTQTIAGAKTLTGLLSTTNEIQLNDSKGIYFGGSLSSPFVFGASGVVKFATSGFYSFTVGNRVIGLGSDASLSWSSTTDGAGTKDIHLLRDAAGTLAQRNSTYAQTFRVYNTYTSSTSFETLQIQNVASTGTRIGYAIGSAGGTGGAARQLDFGRWNAAGTWSSLLTWDANDFASFSGNVIITDTSNYSAFRHLNSSFGCFGDGGGFAVASNLYQAIPTYNTGTSRSGFSANSGRLASIFSATHTTLATTSFYDWRYLPTGTGVTSYSLMRLGFDGAFTLTQPVSTSGSPTGFTWTGGAHTTLALSTEATDVNFNLARTVQFATGALTTQRAMRIQAPTYAFASASTITTASTLSISGAPVAGTNATISTAFSLYSEGGLVGSVGDVVVTTATGAFGVRSGTGGSNRIQMKGGSGLEMASACYVAWGPNSTNVNSPDVFLYRDAAGTLALRNAANVQSLGVYGTWTSTTSYERLNVRGKSSANFEIGPENGSAGGTLRGLTIGGYSAGSTTITPWLSFTSSGTPTFDQGTVVIPSGGTGLMCQQTNIYLDSYGTHSGIRYRRSEGTQGSPTGVAFNSLVGFVGTYGYHTGSAYHTTKGASIDFYATEAYTSGAQGTKIVFGTTPNGTTTNTVALTIDQNQVATFSKLVAQSAAEITSTPAGTTQTITLNDGNHQTLTLTSSTGAVTVTLTVPSNVSSGTIIVKQHGTTPRGITWAVSAGTIKWMGTEPTWSGDAVNDIRIVSWRYDGSVMYLMSTDKAA